MINTKNKWAKCFLLKRLEKVNTQRNEEKWSTQICEMETKVRIYKTKRCLFAGSICFNRFFSEIYQGEKDKIFGRKGQL